MKKKILRLTGIVLGLVLMLGFSVPVRAASPFPLRIEPMRYSLETSVVAIYGLNVHHVFVLLGNGELWLYEFSDPPNQEQFTSRLMLTDVVAITDIHREWALALQHDGTLWSVRGNVYKIRDGVARIGRGAGEQGVDATFLTQSGELYLTWGGLESQRIATGVVDTICDRAYLTSDGRIFTWSIGINSGHNLEGIVRLFFSSVATPAWFALNYRGELYGWGLNNHGSAGVGQFYDVRGIMWGGAPPRLDVFPHRVEGVYHVQSMYFDNNRVFARDGNGVLWEWGGSPTFELPVRPGARSGEITGNPIYFYPRISNLSEPPRYRPIAWITGGRTACEVISFGTGGEMRVNQEGTDIRLPVRLVNNVLVADTPEATPTTPATPVPQPAAVGVTIDGVPQAFEVPPQIIDGRTMLPLRAIGEALGMEVSFNSATNTATLTAPGILITHIIHTNQITVNGAAQTFDASSTVIDGRTLLPLRMLAEAIGADVQWDAVTRTAAITTS